ncbi:MAG TPA: sulfurtransferase [Candidatus Binatia bacterium]|nr:sulfurtransferase [Candidatus Binatia bacterium]
MTLIAARDLAARLARPDDIRVVDVRWYLGRPGDGRRAFDEGHIPGAIHLDIDADLVAPEGPGRHPLPSPSAFKRRLEAAGIGDRHLVVAYDDAGGSVAARLWWMLDDLGHRATAVLDGGFPAWLAAGLPVVSSAEEAAPPPEPATLTLAERWSKVIDRDTLRDRLGRLVVLDARAGARYRGEVEPIDPVAGHIPTALSAPVDGNVGPDGRLLSAAELARRYRDLDAGGSGVVVYCGSGITACDIALARRVAGLPDPILYPGSYSDWSRSGMPVVTGTEPGSADLAG